MILCDYGCGQEAKYQFKNGKWCCSKHFNSCPVKRKKMEETWKDPNSIFNSIEYKENQSKCIKDIWDDPNSKYNLPEFKEKQSKSKVEMWNDPNSKLNSIKFTIEKINERYPLFSKVEQMRYNPDKPEEIQVHCKNHECENSKDKDGWFNPTSGQLYHRINTIENPIGFGESHFYCSQYCKDTCILYNSRKDPCEDNDVSREVQPELRQMKFKIDNYTCQKCKKHQDELDVPLHCHHVEGIRWEPLESADLDKVITVCADCHKKIHQIEGCGYNDMKCGEKNEKNNI